MFLETEELTRIYQKRLAREAQVARIAKASCVGEPGLAQRMFHNAGETFVSFGSWMKEISQGEPSCEHFEIRYNL